MYIILLCLLSQQYWIEFNLIIELYKLFTRIGMHTQAAVSC